MAEAVKKPNRIKEFFKAAKGELKKIVWPNFKTVCKNTGVVIAYVVIIGILVFILDLAFSSVLQWVLGFIK